MIDMLGLYPVISRMKSDVVQNYVIPGLDSYLLTNGKVRLFECSRNHQENITPHSHRFDFACLVLNGEVTNHLWFEDSSNGDWFQVSEISYQGEIGKHDKNPIETARFDFVSKTFKAGDIYSMTASQIHSINFSRNAVVLFFEGPEVSNKSQIIEPFVNGKVAETYEKREYMFIKGEPK